MSDLTTIKVSARTQDRLREQTAGYRTMDGYLDHLLDQEERRRKVEALRGAIQATSVADLASWQAESDAWEHASSRGCHGELSGR